MTTDEPEDEEQWIKASELAELGFTPQDVARQCPWAVEYTDATGEPFWLLNDLQNLWNSNPKGNDK